MFVLWELSCGPLLKVVQIVGEDEAGRRRGGACRVPFLLSVLWVRQDGDSYMGIDERGRLVSRCS